MTKVITERPRYGRGVGPKGYERAWQRVATEDRPRCESMKRPHRASRKSFTDLLGPLQRFLNGRVGRPWDDVYSEICAEVRGRRFSIHREHLLTHVFQFVERDVVLVLGWPCRQVGYGAGEPLATPYTRFYLCPRTGQLRRVPIHPPTPAHRERIRAEFARMG